MQYCQTILKLLLSMALITLRVILLYVITVVDRIFECVNYVRMFYQIQSQNCDDILYIYIYIYIYILLQ